jgi:hypothetical protein
MFTSAVNLQVKIREKAFEFLSKAQAEESLITAFRRLGATLEFGENGILIRDPETVRQFYLSAEARAYFIPSMVTVLNFFEEMAILVRRDAVDEVLLRDFYCGMLCRAFPVWREMASLARNIPLLPGHHLGKTQRPDLYENVEWLHRRWLRHYLDSHFWGHRVITPLPIE